MAMPPWNPDWRKMMSRAPEIPLADGEGYVYIIADSHLGDERAPTDEFFAMLGSLPEARLVVFLGDLFKVWLAIPKFWDDQTRIILKGFQRLRDAGVPILFVVGNRDYFLPSSQSAAGRRGLPFDHIVPDACVLSWGNIRYGLAHGDNINRADRRHLKSRWITRSRPFEALFTAMPGGMARSFSLWMEKALAGTNLEMKARLPVEDIRAFAETVMEGLDGFFVGHFHLDQTLEFEGLSGPLRIVPDWHAKKLVLRIDEKGVVSSWRYSLEGGLAKS